MMNTQLAAELTRLASLYGVDALRAEAESLRLPDFSRAMETELLKLVEFTQPVWRNEATARLRKPKLTRRAPKDDVVATRVADRANARQGASL